MSHQNLWAPWRMQYVQQLDGSAGTANEGDGSDCFLCAATAVTLGTDEAREHHVLVNDRRGLILLNRYPYTNGHLLIAPTQHLADLSDLDSRQRLDLIDLVTLAEGLLRTAINPQGLNIGINLGRCAGAGLPGHVHVHAVPRWHGDTNYMQAIGCVRVIPQALEESYEHLADSIKKLETANPDRSAKP